MADPTAAVAGSSSQTPWRILLWVVLILFALFYLAPLYVMIATSLDKGFWQGVRASVGQRVKCRLLP